MFEEMDIGKITQMMQMFNGGKMNPADLLKMTGASANPQMAQLLKLLPLLSGGNGLAALGNLFGGGNNPQQNSGGSPPKGLPPKDAFAYDLFQLSKS